MDPCEIFSSGCFAPLPVHEARNSSIFNDSCSDLDSEMSRVLDILNSAEDILSSNDQHDLASFEPTPIGPQGLSAQSNFMNPMFNSSVGSISPFLTGYQYSEPSLKRSALDYNNFPSVKRQCLSFPSSKDCIDSQSHSDALLQLEPKVIGSCSFSKSTPATSTSSTNATRFRQYQEDQWEERLQDIVDFEEKHGNCLVPHNFPENQQLAQWVKRQRYQHKLKGIGRHSTLTDARETTLNRMRFVWDSHKAAWIEKWEVLKAYRNETGHCSVPSNYNDRQLSIWVKCQRRQYKLYTKGQKSTMTEERFGILQCMGFDWNPRNLA